MPGPKVAPALAAIDVRKSLPLGHERINILKGISFQIQPGEFVALIGPSGSGKSTLLGIIARPDTPTTGPVLIDGITITKMSEAGLAAIRSRSGISGAGGSGPSLRAPTTSAFWWRAARSDCASAGDPSGYRHHGRANR